VTVNLIGIVGLLCIAGAWIPQTVKTIREKRCDIGKSFLSLYTFGSISLTVYAILNFDPIFLALNLLATIQSLINFYYKYFPKSLP
jgi:MtN3 and saliva related transmembrane protein